MFSKDFKYSTTKDGKYITVLPIDDICEIIQTKFSNMQKRIETLQAENETLKDKAYVDTRLADIKKELDGMKEEYFRGFLVSYS